MGLHTRVMTQTNFSGEKGRIGARSSVLFICCAANEWRYIMLIYGILEAKQAILVRPLFEISMA